MKQLLIFFILLIFVMGADLYAVNMNDYRKETITVNVSGAVETPGSYELPLYASVQDLLEQCGIREDADTTAINPNLILSDKDTITVPQLKEDGTERISINTASKEQLCTLPGIGPSTAEKIIAYRNENGLFQSIEDIMNVSGIGQAKFEKIKDMITL